MRDRARLKILFFDHALRNCLICEEKEGKQERER